MPVLSYGQSPGYQCQAGKLSTRFASIGKTPHSIIDAISCTLCETLSPSASRALGTYISIFTPSGAPSFSERKSSGSHIIVKKRKGWLFSRPESWYYYKRHTAEPQCFAFEMLSHPTERYIVTSLLSAVVHENRLPSTVQHDVPKH